MTIDGTTNGARVSWRDWLSAHMGIGGAEKVEVYRQIAASATLRDVTYWAETIFSAGIATLGLTLGSPAVIIGAMLISPLMNPMMAGGVALAAGDFILAIRAAINIGLSCFAAIVCSTLLVSLLPFREMTAEIAARTHPNTLDLIIALLSGAVGALAISKSLRGIATSLPGVAIAVALMPPLCVVGYGLGVVLTVDAAEGWAVVRGGGLLFATNLIAIIFASMLVFLLLHIDAEEVRERAKEVSFGEEDATLSRLLRRMPIPAELARIGSLPARLVMAALLMVAVFLPLKRSFDTLAREIRQRQHLNVVQRDATRAWESRFARAKSGERRSYIDSIDSSEDEGLLRLSMRVFTSRALTPQERSLFVTQVAKALHRAPQTIALNLVEIPTSGYEVAAHAKEPAPKPEPTPSQKLAVAGAEMIAAASQTPLPSTVVLLDTRIVVTRNGEQVVLAYLADQEMAPDTRELVEHEVQRRLGSTVKAATLEWVSKSVTLQYPKKRTAVPDGAQGAIEALTDALVRFPSLQVNVSAPGTELAKTRVSAVTAVLLDHGVPAERIVVSHPADVADNTIGLSIGRAGS